MAYLVLALAQGTGAGFDLENITLDSTSAQLSAPTTFASGICFSPVGDMVYVTNSSGGTCYQHSLSTPWDITSSISFVGQGSMTTGISPLPAIHDFFLSPDGSKAYVADYAQQEITQWTLTTPYTVSTKTSSVDYEVGENSVYAVWWKPDGTKMYVGYDVPFQGNRLAEFNVSTPWDISTATSSGVLFDPTGSAGWVGSMEDIHFTADGNTVFLLDAQTKLFEFSMSTAWDLTSATLVKSSSSLSTIAGAAIKGIYVKDDATSIFGVDTSGFLHKFV